MKPVDTNGSAEPGRWPTIELGEVCEVQLGKMLSPKSKMGTRPVSYLRNENVQWNRFELGDVSWMDFTEDEERKFLLKPGDLLVCEGGEPGRAAVWTGQIERCCYQKALHRIRPHDDRISPRFLMYRLWLSALSGEFTGTQTKTTIAHLPREKLIRLPIPLPPLAEQERIAAELTAALAAVDAARRAARDRLAAAEALPAAYLREVFEGSDASEWESCPLGDSLVDIESGTSVLAEARPAEDGEWGVLKVSAVSWGRFKPEENKAVPRDYLPAQSERVKVGDLLISRCNTAELAGAVVLVRVTPPNLMLSDKTLRLVLKPDTYDPAFLELALRTRNARRFIEGRATGTSHSMRNISQDTIRLIPLPRPPVEVQRDILARFDKQARSAEALIARCREELAAIDALPAALLRRAFGGS